MAKSQDIIVGKDEVDCRLSTWIRRKNKRLNFSAVNTLCRKGLVRVNGLKTKASYRLAKGDVITVPSLSLAFSEKEPDNRTDPKLAKLLLESIIYKDKYIIALNKPSGIASQGGSRQGARHIDAFKSSLQLGANDVPRLIHRLDKETSGILLLARDVKTANYLNIQFREKLVQKIYWALVEGVPKKEEGILQSYIGKEDIWSPNIEVDAILKRKSGGDKNNKKKALTYYKVIEKIGAQYSWLQLEPSTGRTHQLRIHCAELGNPIVGDRKYKHSEDTSSQDLPYIPKKLSLHARGITFMHPTSKKTTTIEAELPKHMDSVWKYFGWHV